VKKIGICLLGVLLLVSHVKAEGLKIDYKKEKEGYVLEYKSDDKVLSYETAKKEFNVEEYLILSLEDKEHYFYQGKEIDKETYEKGIIENEADKRCAELKEQCIRVHNTDEVKKAIDETMKNDKSVEAHLVYSKSEYQTIDFANVMTYFEEHYLTSIDKNMFTYEEYGKIHPIKSLPHYTEEELVLNGLIKKTNSDEEKKVETFMESFLPLLKDKSDYEKILGAYIYISNRSQYIKDTGYENFIEAYLSPYDVFIEEKAVCIGKATAFQYLMEKLGIQSYIVDHVTEKKKDTYTTSHTYNLVRLDGTWYIIDIVEKSMEGFLLGFNDKTYSKEDYRYYDIAISFNDYFKDHPDANKEFSFDYKALEKVVLKLRGEEKKKEETTTKQQEEKKSKGSELQYFLLSGILLILFVVIYLFTRKK